MNIDAATIAELVIRGMTIGILCFLAAIVVRDNVRGAKTAITALLALGTAAHVAQSASGFMSTAHAWHAPIVGLAAGNAVVLWLFARLVFDDAFRLGVAHGVAWALVAIAALLGCAVLRNAAPSSANIVERCITIVTFAFAALTVGQSLTSWRADLIEGRRRMRVFIVVSAVTYAIVHILGRSLLSPPSAVVELVDAIAIASVVLVAALQLTRASTGVLFGETPAMHVLPTPLTDDVSQLITALERLMRDERMYRREGLTIAGLAQALGTPEYRLRRLINQRLGHRNFNSFINRYRIDDAKAALTDPTQAEVTILTIALDAGFNSIGPFNRAFKADTGMTPSDYRRARKPDAPISEIG